MAVLAESSSYDNVYQLEEIDDVVAGAGGIANLQAQSLLNRTRWLKDHALISDPAVAAYVAGDLFYATGPGVLAKRALGSLGQVLTSGASVPQWSSSLSLGGTLDVSGLSHLHDVQADGVVNVGGLGVEIKQNGTTFVSTSATTIAASVSYAGANTTNLTLVSGILVGDGGQQFSELILWTTNGTFSVIASSSSGSVAARTYSVSGANLKVAMSAGTYEVNTLNTRIAYEN